MDDIDPERLLFGTGDWIGPETQETLSAHPLDCVDTEYPHAPSTVESQDGEGRPEPSDQHPAFYGCFDWHSAVHSHWCLVRQLRLFDNHPRREEMTAAIEAHLTPDAIEQEVEYLETNPSFEKPYGWAWLLRLAAELALWAEPPGPTLQETLSPLTSTVRSLVETEFLTQEQPVRVGTHGNSAFALAGIVDYAHTVGDGGLASTAAETARQFYAVDRSYPVEYEPLGWDFLSPALTEADLMRRVLDREEFRAWSDRFFPDLTADPYREILEPIAVDSHPDDGAATHLLGLNVSKAWCLAGLSETLAEHRYQELFAESARRHVTAGLAPALTDDYPGSHWLSSFVLYLATRTAAGIVDPGETVA